MRVIAGAAGGLRLVSPKGLGTRPTADRVKESIFSILSPYLADACVLDLYAGSGALAIEALSRGARRAVLVDHSREAVAAIRKNLAHTGFTDQSDVWRCPAAAAVRRLADKSGSFNLIFADPPYGQGLAPATLRLIAENSLLAQDGWLVIEHGSKEEMPEGAQNLILYRQNMYGETAVSMFRPRLDSQ